MAAKILSFNELNDELKKSKTFLLDVREKEELKNDGKISQSKNIPLGEIQGAFALNEEAFKKKYGFDKPKADQNVIIHCKMGKRAQSAAETMGKEGYSCVKVYPGILDWIEKGGIVEK